MIKCLVHNNCDLIYYGLNFDLTVKITCNQSHEAKGFYILLKPRSLQIIEENILAWQIWDDFNKKYILSNKENNIFTSSVSGCSTYITLNKFIKLSAYT